MCKNKKELHEGEFQSRWARKTNKKIKTFLKLQLELQDSLDPFTLQSFALFEQYKKILNWL